MYKKYSDYTTSDFAADESFRKWVKDKTKDDELDQYWSGFRLRYPHKAAMMQEAEQMVWRLSQPSQTQVDDAQAVWRRIRQQALSSHQEARQIPMPARRQSWPVLRYAAAVALVAAVGVALWSYNDQRDITVSTGYGEQRTITLPDRSVVRLGANSYISYRHHWSDDRTREIWMRGEGRFSVQHLNRDTTRIATHQRFIVHVEDQLDVEVLGTVFTIQNRRGKTHVALESGAIQVRMDNKTKRLTHQGQFIDAVPAEQRFDVAQRDTPALSGQDGMLTLDGMTVRDIIFLMEDNYGLKLIARDASLLGRKVDGALPLNDESSALAALSSILNVNVSRHQDVVTLEPKE